MNNMQGMPNPSQPSKLSSSAGVIVAVVILLAVLVIGGFYFWGERASTDAGRLYQGSTSDETADIEADLNATDVENVDYDLNPENFNAS